MKNSLKSQLNNWIKRDGFVSYNEIKRACETGEFGQYYRITTAERRLRKSESPEIEAVIENGYITGYKYTPPPPLTEDEKLKQFSQQVL